MENISGADIRTTLVVIGAFVALIIAVLSLVSMIRKEKELHDSPINNLREQVKDHGKRISALESAENTNVTENKLMMRMQLALIRHAIDGNNIEGLRDMREEVQNYLVNK